MKVVQDLTRYSEKAINQFINDAVGRPFKNEQGEVIGVVESCKRVSETRLVQINVKLIEGIAPA